MCGMVDGAEVKRELNIMNAGIESGFPVSELNASVQEPSREKVYGWRTSKAYAEAERMKRGHQIGNEKDCHVWG
jgi:hypothetical protein